MVFGLVFILMPPKADSYAQPEGAHSFHFEAGFNRILKSIERRVGVGCHQLLCFCSNTEGTLESISLLGSIFCSKCENGLNESSERTFVKVGFLFLYSLLQLLILFLRSVLIESPCLFLVFDEVLVQQSLELWLPSMVADDFSDILSEIILASAVFNSINQDRACPVLCLLECLIHLHHHHLQSFDLINVMMMKLLTAVQTGKFLRIFKAESISADILKGHRLMVFHFAGNERDLYHSCQTKDQQNLLLPIGVNQGGWYNIQREDHVFFLGFSKTTLPLLLSLKFCSFIPSCSLKAMLIYYSLSCRFFSMNLATFSFRFCSSCLINNSYRFSSICEVLCLSQSSNPSLIPLWNYPRQSIRLIILLGGLPNFSNLLYLLQSLSSSY